MPRLYKVPATLTVTAAGGNTDVFQLNPSGTGGRTIRLVGFRLGNTTEVGDAMEEGLELQLMHMAATVTDGGGTGSATVTPVPTPRVGGTAAGFTARVNSPTVATSSGTSTILEYIGWINRMSPLEIWYPDPKWCHEAIATESIILRCNTTLVDDMVCQVVIFVEEEG
jgi:hypothetical protein